MFTPRRQEAEQTSPSSSSLQDHQEDCRIQAQEGEGSKEIAQQKRQAKVDPDPEYLPV